MPRYYNKTSGLLTVILADGSSTTVGSRKWLPVTKAQDGSSDLRKKMNKGFLVRRADPTPAPEPSPEPVMSDEEVVEALPDLAAEETDPPSMTWRKDDLVAHAEAMGLDVSDMTKAEILEVIEGAA
jgi:hypothetical protein